MRRVTVTITDEAHARAEREAADAGMTVAQWIAWLAETYEPPQEVDMSGQSMDAYDEAQQIILDGWNQDDAEMHLIKTFPELNAQGLIPTILRKAAKDLARI